VQEASFDDQLRLLRAHPALGESGPLTAHSTSEQHDAGFDRITPERAATLADLNRRYRARFDFPFIIAVRGQKDAQAIITQLERRLANDDETELATALHEVGRIAWFRLQSLEPSMAR
jgi:2-oxo-4-hydroxy-4-carboxy-5-ureidoimidazoline decarboxylase